MELTIAEVQAISLLLEHIALLLEVLLHQECFMGEGDTRVPIILEEEEEPGVIFLELL